MAVLAAWFAWDLRRSRSWWALSFLFFGLSAFLGGSWHGFSHMLAEPVGERLWLACVLFAIASSACVYQAACSRFSRSKVASRIGWGKAGLATVYAIFSPSFEVVLMDFVLTLLFLGWWAHANRRQAGPEARLMLAGIAAFAVGGIVQQSGWSISTWFNHNDLFHVIQIVGNTLFFLGARRSSGSN